jgi:hypothetical protein
MTEKLQGCLNTSSTTKSSRKIYPRLS